MTRRALLGTLALVAALGAGGILWVWLWARPSPALRLVYKVKEEPGPKAALLQRTLRVLRRRAKPEGGQVELHRARFLVDLPRLGARRLQGLKRRLVRRAALALRRVDDSSSLLRRIISQAPPPEGLSV